MECSPPISEEISTSSVESECTDELLKQMKVHWSAAVPLPFGVEEKENEIIFVDPNSGEGKRILTDPETSISELFALMRQFVAPVCDNIGLIVNEMIDRKVTVNDIDATTGMSMIHYVVRAESIATDKYTLLETLNTLIIHGADLSQKTLLTDFNAFHIAALFDCAAALETMINRGHLSDDDVKFLVNSPSVEFDCGSPLHIAAANLSVNAAKVLIKHGADVHLRDDIGRTPAFCIPNHTDGENDVVNIGKFRDLLSGNSKMEDSDSFSSLDIEETNHVDHNSKFNAKQDSNSHTVKPRVDSRWEFSVGDIVLIGGTKRGTIKFIGPTQFASGTWCGIELDECIGKNDGSINDVRYFTCDPTRGVFAPPNKLVLTSPRRNSAQINGNSHEMQQSKMGSIHSCTGLLSGDASPPTNDKRLRVGMTVYLNHLKEYGKIRYIGETDFAAGIWVGLALSHPVGKNNGTVRDRQYFKCKSKHGIMVRPTRVSVDGVNGASLL